MSTEATFVEVGKAQERLRALHTAIDAEAILSFPLSASMVFGERDAMFAHWINHPLSVSNRAATDAPCKTSVKEKFDKGVYMDTICQAVVNKTIVKRWMVDRPAELEQPVAERRRCCGHRRSCQPASTPIATQFPRFDAAVIRAVLTPLFEKINTDDSTVEDAVSRVQTTSELEGFEMRNVYRWTHDDLARKVDELISSITVPTSVYPAFDLDIPVSEQQLHLFDPTAKKLLLYSDIRADIAAMLVADLENPFCSDYIVNAPPTKTTVFDIQPHLGELVCFN
ncbi:hypothetical protein PC128_g12892 [Phytophthora cactorum]|nr:hypothetical protein PC128_g12892 [Phytophthora cactorum]